MSGRRLLSRGICGVALGLWLVGTTAATSAVSTKLPDEESTWTWAMEHVYRRGEVTEAQALATVDAAHQANDPAAEMTALANLLAVYWESTPAKAEPAIQRTLALAREHGDRAWEARALYMQASEEMADDYRNLDDADATANAHWRVVMAQAMAIGRSMSLQRLMADAYFLRGTGEAGANRGSDAIDDLDHARQLFALLHVDSFHAATLVKLAAGYRVSRNPSPQDLQTAQRELSDAVALFDPRVDSADLILALTEKGQVEQKLGRTDDAIATLKQAVATPLYEHHPDLPAEAAVELGRVLLAKGLYAEAVRYARPACGAVGASGFVVLCADVVARAEVQLGHRDQALAALAEASAAARTVPPKGRSVVFAAAAEVWATLGDYRQANEALQAQMRSDAEAVRLTDVARMQQLQAQFQSELKDRDNALLRARAGQADSARAASLLALLASVLLLGGGALVLLLRLRVTRAANTLIATLADDGRQLTSSLDGQALVGKLKSRLDVLLRPATTAVWLVDEEGSLARVDGPLQPHELETQLQAIRERCELEMAAVSTRPRARGALRWWPWRASSGPLCVAEPLLNGAQLIGIVALGFDEGRRWRNRERQILRTTCLYAAVALANIRTAQLLGESQVELEQERTRDMLVHTARLVTVGSMASGIVHEMSHPVGAMMLQSSNAQASLEIGESVEANEALSGIHREARRLQNLITRLRNLCRADPPQLEDIDVLAVLEDARVLFQPQLHMARVEYVQDAASLVVTVDAERVVLAIANIVFNAVDAMEGRPVKRIEITASARDGFACVDIRDTGPGLTPAQLARLFEPFYTTKPPGKGLGLGLALSVKSVASMNGRIDATNHPDGGAVFSICVPLAAPLATSKPLESIAAGS